MTLLRVAARPLICSIALFTSVAFAQQGIGAKYGSRDPQLCPAMKEPVKGAPSSALAAKYVACNMEKEQGGSTLYLLAGLKVEVGGGTPYLQLPGIHRPGNADPNGLVYSIRGSFKKYQCTLLQKSGMFMNVGKNCRIYDTPKASGTCYHDNFGEWNCSMLGETGYGTADQPPPQ